MATDTSRGFLSKTGSKNSKILTTRIHWNNMIYNGWCNLWFENLNRADRRLALKHLKLLSAWLEADLEAWPKHT